MFQRTLSFIDASHTPSRPRRETRRIRWSDLATCLEHATRTKENTNVQNGRRMATGMRARFDRANATLRSASPHAIGWCVITIRHSAKTASQSVSVFRKQTS